MTKYQTTALKERVKDQKFVEQEQAVIEGIDVSGQWNRMYEPREIVDYDLTYLDKLTALPGGESMGWCYQCAQCVPACPVDTVGGDYAPRKIHRRLQTGTDIFNHRDLWLCTTCMNCLRVCPKEVDMIQIMPAARAVAVLEGNIPDELQEMFQNVAEYGNPMGQSPRKRAKWVRKAGAEIRVLPKEKEPSPVDVLWFVGDYYAYHERGVDAANAMARVFNRLGVDFGILGADERCDGDSQRLAGEPGLFEELAEHNIAQFEKYDFGKIVVSGPHAYNAIKNEYPKLNGGKTFPVEHYTQYLSARLEELKPLLTKPFAKRVTFHDPCYLGRHNGEYDAPRNLLQAVPELEFGEMYRCKAQGYCCGGGGGGMWLDGYAALHQAERLSENRVKEAVEVGAEVLAVCCPYEVSRFEDAVKSTDNDGKLEVLDIIEILDQIDLKGFHSSRPVLWNPFRVRSFAHPQPRAALRLPWALVSNPFGVKENESMDVMVLLRQVPDLVEDLEVDDSGKALDEDCVSLKLNEFDDHALEEALLLKEADGGTVTAVALDGEDVDKMLYTAMAKGADRALKVTGTEAAGYREMAGIFAGVVREQACDLILTGVQAADERDGQLAPMVAALLDRPCVEVVTSVAAGDGHVTVHKEFSGGLMAEYDVDLPAVLGIQAARQTPRYAPVSKVRQIQESTSIETVAGAAGNGSGFAVVEMTPPETGEGAQMLESVDELIEVLESKGVI